jgi:hypothetical protein
MPRKKQFPYRLSIALLEDQGKYLDALVEKKYFDSQAQAVRFFINMYQLFKKDPKSVDNTVLPTMKQLGLREEA